jgi:hypothetical protein
MAKIMHIVLLEVSKVAFAIATLLPLMNMKL